jgi:hypothetical protein
VNGMLQKLPTNHHISKWKFLPFICSCHN